MTTKPTATPLDEDRVLALRALLQRLLTSAEPVRQPRDHRVRLAAIASVCADEMARILASDPTAIVTTETIQDYAAWLALDILVPMVAQRTSVTPIAGITT